MASTYALNDVQFHGEKPILWSISLVATSETPYNDIHTNCK